LFRWLRTAKQKQIHHEGHKEHEEKQAKCLKKFVFWRGWLEAEKTFCESIQLLNKNSLWIRFVDSVSAEAKSNRLTQRNREMEKQSGWHELSPHPNPLPASQGEGAKLSAARSDSTPPKALRKGNKTFEKV
jgi:hypothetical protein